MKKNRKQVGQRYLFCYNHCPTDKKGWVDANFFLPKSFDLVRLRIERNGKKHEKTFPGWYTGTNWEGAKIKPEDKITHWIRIKEDES
jgi:hypothetical protein